MRCKAFHLFSTGLLTTIALLTAWQLSAQTVSKSGPDQKKEFATLSVQVDSRGSATVHFWLPLKPGNPGAVERALEQSLSFPLEFNRRFEEISYDEEDDEIVRNTTWFLVEGKNDKAFVPRSVLASKQGMDFLPLADAIQPLGLKTLMVGIMFDGKRWKPTVTGANGFGPSGLNYYQVQIDLNAPTVTRIEFSLGYSTTDIIRKLLPISAFLLLPLMLTLWMIRSVLRMRDRPAEMWGRYFGFLFRLFNLIFLVWIPVCSWSSLGEILSLATGLGNSVLIETVKLLVYFVPPVLVIFCCHLVSGPVYRRVHGVEWSPREVVGKAILGNSLSLFPLFFAVWALNTLTAGTSRSGMFLVLAVGCWVLWIRLCSKALKPSLYAVTHGEFRDRVFDLAHKAGVALNQIYVLPEAKAQMSNAFARSDNAVMITASLLKHLSKREVDGIIAHEIGHLKEKHPQTRIWVTAIVIVVVNFLAMALASIFSLEHSAPVIFSLGIAAAMLVLHFLSRSNERHADALAIMLTADPERFISAMAKLSKLNLMQLHSSGWGESLETHPRMIGRLRDIGRMHGISDDRFKELLDAPETSDARYSIVEATNVQAKIFSTDIKKKHTVRGALALLATIVLVPFPFAFLFPRMNLSGAALWCAYILGVILTLGIYQTFRNFVSFWGHRSLESQLRARLRQQGFAEAARSGIAVGLSPSATPSKYEGWLFWDVGVVWLTRDQLCYIGEETQFALERSQILGLRLENACAEWFSEKSLYITYQPTSELSETFSFLALGSGSMLQARRHLESLHRSICAWLEQPVPRTTGSLNRTSLNVPSHRAITSQPASNKFNLWLVLKACVQMSCMSGILSFALRLPFATAVYMIGAIVLIILADELPKLVRRPPQTVLNHLATRQIEEPAYNSGSWAESTETAVTEMID